MTAFMITMFVLHVLGAGMNMADLSTKQYPYVKEQTYGGTLFSLLITSAFAIWAGILIL